MAEYDVDALATVVFTDAETVNVEPRLADAPYSIKIEPNFIAWRDRSVSSMANVVLVNGFQTSKSVSQVNQNGNTITLQLNEYVGISDQVNVARRLELNLSETVGVQDELSPAGSRQFNESFSISDQFSKVLNKTIIESVNIVDSVTTGRLIRIDMGDGFGIVDSKKFQLTKNISENITIRDHYYENSNATLSEFKILNTDIDENEFERLLNYAAPVEYKDFKPFIAGDYNYQNAYLRYAFRSQAGDIARLNTCKIIVDVPDVKDRGFVDCVDTGWVTVTFNRAFYTPPEVQVTIKSGFTVGAIPEVEAATLTNTSFRVRLKTATNSFVAGRVSWSALGY